MLCTRHPQNGGPNWETNEARGGGSCTGPVEVNRGPLMTSGLVRLIGGCYVVPTGPPSHFPPSAFLTLGTASSLSGGAAGYGRMLLCEVDYTGKPAPRIPGINTFRERYDMWLLKKFGLPWLYWNVLLRGRKVPFLEGN